MDLLISGADLFTAVGATAEITYFSVRAGLNRFTETGAVTRRRQPRIAAVLPHSRHHRDEARLAALAAESAVRALDHAGIDAARTIGVTLCLAAHPRPDAPASLDVWKSTFRDLFNARKMAVRIRALIEAPASVAHALHEAAASLDRGDEDVTLIGGADSWLSLHALRWLEDHRRLKVAGRAEGLIPGEAAGFLVLESARRRIGRQPPLAVLRAASLAHEPGYYDSDDVCLSVGYSQAVHAALRDIDPDRPPRVLLSDLNGESYRAKEWAAAEVRTMPQSPAAHFHPADCFGDVGCMAAVAQLAIAAVGLSRGEWGGPAIVIAGSDGSARGVMIADTPAGRGGRLEPNLEGSMRGSAVRSVALDLSSALVDDHLEEAGFLRLQRRLAEQRSAERWSQRDAHDRRHAWHLLALAASVEQAEQAFAAAIADGERPPEDRAAAVSALALAGVPLALRFTWLMMKGKDGRPAALIEAFSDLPEASRRALRQNLEAHQDSRVRALALEVFGTAIAEPDLVARLAESASVEAREDAAAALVDRGGHGLDILVDSQRVRALLSAETIAWAAVRSGRSHAAALVRSLSEREVTPRLLEAMGGSGYTDAIPFLLHFVADESTERADAAAASLAAITGVDVVQPGVEEDAANETWSRSPDRWKAALGSAFAGRSVLERMVVGGPWSPERVMDARADPQARNGVRRALATAIDARSVQPGAAAYYWLQRRQS